MCKLFCTSIHLFYCTRSLWCIRHDCWLLWRKTTTHYVTLTHAATSVQINKVVACGTVEKLQYLLFSHCASPVQILLILAIRSFLKLSSKSSNFCSQPLTRRSWCFRESCLKSLNCRFSCRNCLPTRPISPTTLRTSSSRFKSTK